MSYVVKKKALKRIEHSFSVEVEVEKKDEAGNVIPAVKKEVAVWIDFKPQAAEDIDYTVLMSKMADKEKMVTQVEEKDEKTGEVKMVEKIIDGGSYNALLYSIRTSIKAWCDEFTDEDNNVLPFNQDNQVAVFEAVREIPGFFDKVLTAYTGITSKN